MPGRLSLVSAARTLLPALSKPNRSCCTSSPDQKNDGVSCYNKQAYATSGEGPCGSWCTKDISVGAGCGDNHKHLCKTSNGECHAGLNVSACKAECDAIGHGAGGAGCNAFNLNRSHGCCLLSCPTPVGPPGQNTSTNSPASNSGCCGYWRKDSTTSARPTVMMRAIDIVGMSRSKALLWAMVSPTLVSGREGSFGSELSVGPTAVRQGAHRCYGAEGLASVAEPSVCMGAGSADALRMLARRDVMVLQPVLVPAQARHGPAVLRCGPDGLAMQQCFVP